MNTNIQLKNELIKANNMSSYFTFTTITVFFQYFGNIGKFYAIPRLSSGNSETGNNPSIKTQKVIIEDFVNTIRNRNNMNAEFKCRRDNTLEYVGGAYVNKIGVTDENGIRSYLDNYRNVNRWFSTLLDFKDTNTNKVVQKTSKKNVFVCFTDVHRFFRNVERGIEAARRFASRGVILVFIRNHLVIDPYDINNETDRYDFFVSCLQKAQDYSDQISDNRRRNLKR